MVICGCCVLGHRHRWRMGKPFSFRHRFFCRFHDLIISKIGRGCLVGAALRADRIPTNMGVAQLASHAPPLPQLSHAPDFFHFLRRLPQRSRRRRAPTSEPIGRGGNTALVGAARHSRRSAWLATNREPRLRGGYLRADRAKRTPRRGVPTNTTSGRGGTPCRPHTHKYGRGAIGFSCAPATPTLACARFSHFLRRLPQRSRRRRAPTTRTHR